MGGVLGCCMNESSAIDIDATTAGVALNNGVGGNNTDEKNKNKNDGAVARGLDADADNDDDDDNEIGSSDIFFSARQSFSQLVNELSYPPTSTPKSGRTSNITIDHPETLLLLLHTPVGVINEEGSSSNEESTTTTTTGGNKRPTVILKEKLLTSSNRSRSSRDGDSDGDGNDSKEMNNAAAGYPGELSTYELDACIEFRNRLRDPITDPTYRKMVYLNVDINVNIDNNQDDDATTTTTTTTGGTSTSSTTSVAGKGPEGKLHISK
jgi:hypothetical protein